MSTDIATLAQRLPGIEWTPPAGMTFEDYTQIGSNLARVTRACSWLLGDWVNYGEGHYGERFAQAADVTGYDPATLRNFALIAGQIPPPRRRENLTFSHHAAVLTVKDPATQDRLLDLAASETMTVERLRTEARAFRRAGAPDPLPVDRPEPQWSEPSGYDTAVEQVRSALRALAAVTGAQSQITAVWVSGDGSTNVFVEIDGIRR